MAAKGEARRAALVEAAAAVVSAQGFGALSHRAVAAQAELPLAATTYYFGSLTDLAAAAAELLAERHVSGARTRVAGLPRRPVSAATAARHAVAVVLPPALDDAAMLGLYERYLEAGRSPHLRPVVTRWNDEVRQLLGEVLDRTGRDGRPALVLALVDGLAVTALAEGRGPRSAAEKGLAALLGDNLEP